MKLSHIVACSNNNVIGNDLDIPWKSKIDLQFFKSKTLDKVCIVGRKTYETIKHLKRRHFIVITSNKIDGIDCVKSVEEAIALAKMFNQEEVFVIGGGQIYKQTFKHIDKAYVTSIQVESEGDIFYELPDNFKLIKDSLPIKDNDFFIQFKEYEKRA